VVYKEKALILVWNSVWNAKCCDTPCMLWSVSRDEEKWIFCSHVQWGNWWTRQQHLGI